MDDRARRWVGVLVSNEDRRFHNPLVLSNERGIAGGQRRKREGTLAAAYDLTGLDSITALYRLMEIITFDALSLDNSVARGRLLLGVVNAGIDLLETGDQEESLRALEATIDPVEVKRLPRRNR